MKNKPLVHIGFINVKCEMKCGYILGDDPIGFWSENENKITCPKCLKMIKEEKMKNKCVYYCSPTCHPAQVGPEWVYGCLHPAWPQNKAKDFCPIVRCNGSMKICDLRANKKLYNRYRAGLKRRIKYSEGKLERLYDEWLKMIKEEQQNEKQIL